MKKFVSSFLLLLVLNLPSPAQVTEQSKVQPSAALSAEPIKLGGISVVAPKFTLEGTGEYKLPEFVEVKAKLEGTKPANLVSLNYEWRIFEHVVDESGFIAEHDLRVKTDAERLSFYAVVDNKRYSVVCTVTGLYVVRDKDGKVTEIATKTVLLRGIVTVGTPGRFGPGPAPQPGPGPGPNPNPGPAPIVTKQKMIVVVVSDMKNQNPALADALRSETLSAKLASGGHEFKTYNAISPDIQTNGIAKILTARNVPLPALVMLKLEGDRGAVINAVPCPTTEAEIVAAITKAGGF